MKKLIYILLLVSISSFAQINVELNKKTKVSEYLNPNLTVVDYGAVLYRTKEDALKGKKSSSKAIQKMMDDLIIAKGTSYGWLYVDESVYMYFERNSFNGNGVNLVTDKPIKMFRPIFHNQEIKDFTAHFTGQRGGVVVYVGAPHKGGVDIRRDGKTKYHHWKNRTRIIGNVWDFNVVGNYNVTPILINYSKSFDDVWSHVHFTKIRGFWTGVDVGIKIKTKTRTQSLNTIDIDVKIWGARKFADIKGINFSKIRIMGQDKGMLDGDSFYVEGSHLNGDIFIYDLRNGAKGQYHVKGLDLSGYYDLLPYPPTTHIKLNDSKLIK